MYAYLIMKNEFELLKNLEEKFYLNLLQIKRKIAKVLIKSAYQKCI